MFNSTKKKLQSPPTTTRALEIVYGKPLDPNPKIATVTFNIRTASNFRMLPDDPCKGCGKIGSILSGLPNWFTVSMPLSPDDLNTLYEKPFFIGGDFEVTCNKGYSHVVQGLKPEPRFFISEYSDYREGFYVIEPHFEYALLKFFIGYANIIRRRSLASGSKQISDSNR